MATPDEGVVKFHAAHRGGSLPPEALAVLPPLVGWRQVLMALGLVGQEPGRYGGAGFGNLSVRLRADGGAFVITGTQTGGRPRLAEADFALVTACDLAGNRVTSIGPAAPSSEAMTHAAFYALGDRIGAVFHGHGPLLWQRAAALGLPVTDPAVAYGTPAMGAEVGRLARATGDAGVLTMGGHEDGVLAWGRTADEAGAALVSALARALAVP